VNWLAFWASVIGSLAWPATLVIALLIFRRQLLEAAPWLRELEVGNVKVKFAEELAKASSAAEEIQTTPANSPPPPIPNSELLLAEHAPIGLVLQSWMTVENALNDVAVKHSLTSTLRGDVRPMPTHRIISDLRQRGSITTATAQTLSYLRDLRNQVAHRRGVIDSEQALEYARLAKKVVDALNDAPATIPGVRVPG
jgi:hypothetical protein